MFESILEVAVAAAAAAIAAAAPLVIPPLRRWLIEKANLEHILGDDALARRLDQGVLNLIENAMTELRVNLGRKALSDKEVTALATDKTLRQFPATLQRLGMNGIQTREYVKARVQHAASRESNRN